MESGRRMDAAVRRPRFLSRRNHQQMGFAAVERKNGAGREASEKYRPQFRSATSCRSRRVAARTRIRWRGIRLFLLRYSNLSIFLILLGSETFRSSHRPLASRY